MEIQYGEADARVYDAATDVPALTEFTVSRLRSVVMGRRTLDLGCGTGRTTIELARSASRIWALDNSAEMLAVFRKKQVPRNVKLVHADFRDLPRIAAEPFEAVYCTLGSLACCRDISELRRALKLVAAASPGANFSYEFYDGAYYCAFVDRYGKVVPAELPSGVNIVTRFDIREENTKMLVDCTVESNGTPVGSLSEQVILMPLAELTATLQECAHSVTSSNRLGGVLIIDGTIAGNIPAER